MKERSPPALRQCALSADCPASDACGLAQFKIPPCVLICGSLVQPVPVPGPSPAGGSGPPGLPFSSPLSVDSAAVLNGDFGGRAGNSGGAVWIMIGGTAAHFLPDLVEVASSICRVVHNVLPGNSWVVCAIPAEESIQHYDRSYGKQNAVA